jgi:predicted metal-binding membrane protein
VTDAPPALGVPVPRRANGITIVLVAIIASWALAVVAEVTGSGDELHHGALIEGGAPLSAALVVFLVAWQAMTASMMLPSSLPLVRLFFRVASPQPRAARAKAAFIGGYVAVWSAFGAVAFIGDVSIHRVVDASPWLAQRPWLIAGPTLMLAGAFQFSEMKERCLRQCRHPAAFLLPRYRRGATAAFRLGREHGFFCLGCCWALMLVGFAAGVANLWWMAALAAIMVVEKAFRFGDRIVAPVGYGLLAYGALVLLHPAWLPLQPWAA